MNVVLLSRPLCVLCNVGAWEPARFARQSLPPAAGGIHHRLLLLQRQGHNHQIVLIVDFHVESEFP